MFDGLAKLIESAADLADDSRIPWKKVMVASLLGNVAFRTFLDIRQYRVQCRKSLPKVFEGKDIVDEATFRKSQAYSRTNRTYVIIKRAFTSSLNIWIYASGFLPKLWQSASSVAPRFFGGGALTAGLLVYAAISAIKSIYGIPFQLYDTFVIEEKFGMNKETLGLFVKDKLKVWGLWLILGVPLQAAFQGIVAHYGYRFVTYAELFVLLLNVVAQFLVPTLIVPLFNKLTPMEDGELKTEIVKLAKSEGFPVNSIYVIDGSTRSNHSNAYFIGLPGIKQIVLYDTLIKDSSTDEIVAVLAHELGHWKHNHIAKLIAAETFFQGICWFNLALLMKNKSLFKSLGFARNETPVMVSLLLNDVFVQTYVWLDFAQSWFIRHHEYDADAFAAERGHAKELKNALLTLQKSNLTEYDNDPLYSTLHHSHPALEERLAAIELIQKKHA